MPRATSGRAGRCLAVLGLLIVGVACADSRDVANQSFQPLQPGIPHRRHVTARSRVLGRDERRRPDRRLRARHRRGARRAREQRLGLVQPGTVEAEAARRRRGARRGAWPCDDAVACVEAVAGGLAEATLVDLSTALILTDGHDVAGGRRCVVEAMPSPPRAAWEATLRHGRSVRRPPPARCSPSPRRRQATERRPSVALRDARRPAPLVSGTELVVVAGDELRDDLAEILGALDHGHRREPADLDRARRLPPPMSSSWPAGAMRRWRPLVSPSRQRCSEPP